MSAHVKPILGITMGDPAGIGPEIAAKALAERRVYEICRPIVIGDARAMAQAVGIAKAPLAVRPVARVSDALFSYGAMEVYDLADMDMDLLEHGKVSAMAGKAAFEAIKKAIELAMRGEIDGTVTGPINKESLNLAGFHYAGHTEIYADLTGTKSCTMMLADGDLRVVHVSTHTSLRDACDRVTKARVLAVIRLARDACRDLGIAEPRVAVAGLNPHAGEGGMFGREEIAEIAPAVAEARAEGIAADGPLPPDTVFVKARGGMYDIVVAMYHDQGHIPLKMAGFRYDDSRKSWDAVSGVNITLGLPIIRASVDHGTAFGKAGKGTANPGSLLGAIEYAARLAAARSVRGRPGRGDAARAKKA